MNFVIFWALEILLASQIMKFLSFSSFQDAVFWFQGGSCETDSHYATQTGLDYLVETAQILQL